MMEMTTAGMGKNVHLGCVDGSQEAFGLIAVRVEMAMNGGEHTVDLQAFTLGHIEGAVDQDLDLEPLEETVVLAALGVPALDSLALETDTFPVEPRRDLETARMVADHRPGIASAGARARHGLERRSAVGMTGVPVTGAAQPLRVEVLGSGAKSLGHLRAAEIALTRGTATRVLTALKPLDSGLQGVFTAAGDELRDQRPEPWGSIPLQLLIHSSIRIEG